MKTSFDKYQLLERIGVGGMAEVFLAKSQGVEGFEKQLVIKKILPELASNKRFVEMFIAEARIVTALNHPNIVQIYDFGKVEDDFFIAMEYVDGWDLGLLSQLSADVERMSVGDVIWAGLEIARGLDYAHRRLDDSGQSLGLVHRDISPQNILVSRDGAIKIVDFGIAMASLVDEDNPNVVKGKFCYMSPEQAQGERLDHRSDLFSLGVVLFELLCGRTLFKQSSKEQTLSLVKSAVVPDIRDLNPAIPEALEHVLYKLLEREPDARYQNARELQQDLMRVLYGLGSLHDAYSLSDYIQRTRPAIEHEESKPRSSGQTRTVRTNVVAQSSDGPEATTAQVGRKTMDAAFTPVTPAFETDPGREQEPLEILARTRKEVVLIAGVLEGLFALRAEVGQDRWLHIFQEYTRMVDSIAFKSNGVVHRVNESGFVMLLGVPISSENDAERAARVALDLKDAMSGINLGLSSPLKLAMGIAVSEVVLEQGPVRHGQRRYSWSFLGDSHEFAEQLARAGMGSEILMGGQVLRRIKKDYHCELIDGLSLNSDESAPKVQAWRLKHLKSWKERLKEVQHSYHMFYGREVELGALRRSYRQVLMDGVAKGVVVTGEQGVGKSTLVEEFLKGLDPRDVRVVRGVANVLEQGTPLGGVSTLLAELMRLGPREDVRQLRQTLEMRMSALFPDESAEEQEMLLHSMGAIFGLRYNGGVFEGLTGEERRKRTSLTLKKFLRRFAERKPVVLTIDDAHQLDAMTLELATQIFMSRFEAPLFLVFVMTRVGMSEFELARWEKLTSLKYLRLEEISELSREDATKLCVELLRAQRIDDDILTEAIVTRAGGNPFYIKEVVEILRDRGVLQDSGERRQVVLELEQTSWLPTSVEGAIAARLDRLPLEFRSLVQQVALFWSPFTGAEVEQLLDSANILGLEELVQRGFLDRVGEHRGLREEGQEDDEPVGYGEVLQRSYRFCNALTQEVASRMLLDDIASELHGKLADHIIEVKGLNEVADQVRLAYHLQGAGRIEEAAMAYYEAAEDAFGQFGAAESLKLCDQVIACLPDNDDLCFDVLHLKEKALRELGQPTKHKQVLDSLRELVEYRSVDEQVEVWLRLTRYYYDQADFRAALSMIEQVRDAVSRQELKQDAGVILARADQFEAYVRIDQGKRDDALVLIEQAIERLLGAEDRDEVIPDLVSSHNIKGVMLRRAGEHLEALDMYQRAMDFASHRVDGDVVGRRVLVNMGLANMYLGRLTRGIECYERALRQARRLGLRRDEAGVLVNMGHAFVIMGDEDRAISTIQRGIYLARRVNASVILADGEVTLGICYMQMGKVALAERVLVEGLRLAESIPHVYLAVHAMLSLVKLTLGKDEVEEQAIRVALMQAEDCYERSESSNMQWGMLQSSVMMAMAYRALGFDSRAWEMAVQAWGYVQDGEQTGLEDAAKVYGELCVERGELELARDVFEQAIKEVNERASVIDDREDRALFLARKEYLEVVRLLESLDD